MRNRIVLITGSTDGIGKQTALDLVELGAHVIIHGRNITKAKQAVEEIIKKSGKNKVDYVVGDLSSLAQIRDMSDDIHKRFKKIDVLINNAGVYKNKRELSEDGFELTFAVNHLSFFLLTGLLLDLIKKSDYARIVNVASQAHASQIDFENLQGDKFFDGYDAYSRSKLCNILFTYKLSRKLQDTHVTANVLHPGVISTKLLHKGWGSGGTQISQGSKTSVYLATSPEIADETGRYFSNSRPSRSAQISYDISVQDKLWEVSQDLTFLKY